MSMKACASVLDLIRLYVSNHWIFFPQNVLIALCKILLLLTNCTLLGDYKGVYGEWPKAALCGYIN